MFAIIIHLFMYHLLGAILVPGDSLKVRVLCPALKEFIVT